MCCAIEFETPHGGGGGDVNIIFYKLCGEKLLCIDMCIA